MSDQTAAYANALREGELVDTAPYGVIYIDGVPVPVQGQLRYVNLARFEPKITFGNYTEDSDALISSWIQDNWTGGGQAEHLDPGTQGNRFWASTLETRYPNQLALGALVTTTTPPGTGVAMPLGDYGDLFWGAKGDTLSRWNESTSAWVSVTTLSAPPITHGQVYKGALYIPYGTGGYQSWDGTTLTAGTAGITPLTFALWDNKLTVLEHDGQLSFFDGTTWTSPADAKLDTGISPRHLVVFRNQRDEPTLFIITDQDVWAYDPTTPKLFRTGLNYPKHPSQGLASAVWSDTDLYVSVGIGVHRYGGVISGVGLDRDDGVPAELLGQIVDFEPEYNSLYALLEGVNQNVAPSLEPLFDPGTARDEAIIVSSVQAKASLQMWNGTGWHTAWESVGASGAPTKALVSQASGAYRLWFGYAGNLLSLDLRRNFHNPKQGRILGLDRFRQDGTLQTGRFDGNMTGYTKLASHVIIDTEYVSDVETITVRYQTDRNAAWRLLGVVNAANVNASGRVSLPFGVDPIGFSRGEAFGWINFEYGFARGSAVNQSPIMESAILKFMKLPSETTPSWVAEIPLEFDSFMGVGPKETQEFLDRLTTSEAFYPMILGNTTYRVRVSQVQGVQRTGVDTRATRLINLVVVGTNT